MARVKKAQEAVNGVVDVMGQAEQEVVQESVVVDSVTVSAGEVAVEVADRDIPEVEVEAEDGTAEPEGLEEAVRETAGDAAPRDEGKAAGEPGRAPRPSARSRGARVPAGPPAEGYTGEKKSFEEDPWPELYEALRTRAIIQGTVAGLERFEGKDALTVHFGPAKGIIVEDDLGDRPKRLAQMIGSVVAFKVKAIDRRQGRVFLSRKEALEGMAEKTWAALEREAGVVIAIQAKITELLPEVKKLEESSPRYREIAAEIRALRQEAKEKGPKRTGVVRWVTPDGAYVDVGGVMAFLPGKETSYGKVEDAREGGVRVGDNLDVRVYSVDRSKERVLVTLKPFLPDPWASAALKYVKGGLYQGTVSRSLDGRTALVALEPGVEVFVPALPFEALNEGAKVLVRVLAVDSVRRRVSGRISRVLSRAG